MREHKQQTKKFKKFSDSQRKKERKLLFLEDNSHSQMVFDSTHLS
jgi:hypothetical protein